MHTGTILTILRSLMSIRGLSVASVNQQGHIMTCLTSLMQLVLCVQMKHPWVLFLKSLITTFFPLITLSVFLNNNKRFARPNMRFILNSLHMICILLHLGASNYGGGSHLFMQRLGASDLLPGFLFLYICPLLINPRGATHMLLQGPLLHTLIGWALFRERIDAVMFDPSKWYFYTG